MPEQRDMLIQQMTGNLEAALSEQLLYFVESLPDDLSPADKRVVILAATSTFVSSAMVTATVQEPGVNIRDLFEQVHSAFLRTTEKTKAHTLATVEKVYAARNH